MIAARQLVTSRCLSRQLVRAYSEAAVAPPPLMSKLRADLKTAMKAKDKERLNVVKSILSEISNAGMANPPKPVKTDLDILAILNSMEKKLGTSIQEFKTANRQDLVDKEQSQLDIVKSYAGEVTVMSPENLEQIVAEIVERAKGDGKSTNVGDLVKATLAEAEARGSAVLKSQVAAAAKKALGM